MAQPQKPSDKQVDILRFIDRYDRQHRRPPSFREIGRAAGLKAVSAVKYHVARLEEMGLLSHDPQLARAVRLAPDAGRYLSAPLPAAGAPRPAGLVRLPIRGVIAAGEPLDYGDAAFSPFDDDDAVGVDAALLPRRLDDVYAMKVRGDSMIDALIGDGDVVLMERVDAVRNGDMVAAWLPLENEMTLKHFFREGDRVRLQPANKRMSPIFIPARNVEIHGRVVLVLRQVGRGPAH